MAVPFCNEPSVRRGGFTLIELLVAVTLLVMLLWGTSHIFDITVRAMNEATAVNEMTADSPIFYDTLRKDVRGLEANGYLVMGQRAVTGYASHRMRELGRNTTFRCDWMEFFTNTESACTTDMNVVGQWARVFWGQGPRTGQARCWPPDVYLCAPSTSQYATDWILMRHQILLLSVGPSQYQSPLGGSDMGLATGIEASAGNLASSDYQQALKSIYNRNFRWFGSVGHGPTLGSQPMPDNPVNPNYVGYDETIYWHDYIYNFEHNTPAASTSTGAILHRFHLLPHCGTFQIEYAMPGDLRNGPGGTIAWRESSAAASGRTAFAPGDAWPVLLKVTTQVFDPKDRLDKGRTFTAVVPVAR